MVPGWRIIEHPDTGVYLHIVCYHQHSWVEHSLLKAHYWSGGLASQALKMCLRQVDQLLMINFTGPHNDHILSEVISRVEVHNHVPVDLPNVVDIAEDWLAHHVLPVAVVVDTFHACLLRVLIYRLKLTPDRVLFHLEVIVIIDRVTEHVTHYFNRFADTIWEALHVVEGELTACVRIQLGAHVFTFDLKLVPRPFFCALEV